MALAHPWPSYNSDALDFLRHPVFSPSSMLLSRLLDVAEGFPSLKVAKHLLGLDLIPLRSLSEHLLSGHRHPWTS